MANHRLICFATEHHWVKNLWSSTLHLSLQVFANVTQRMHFGFEAVRNKVQLASLLCQNFIPAYHDCKMVLDTDPTRSAHPERVRMQNIENHSGRLKRFDDGPFKVQMPMSKALNRQLHKKKQPRSEEGVVRTFDIEPWEASFVRVVQQGPAERMYGHWFLICQAPKLERRESSLKTGREIVFFLFPVIVKIPQLQQADQCAACKASAKAAFPGMKNIQPEKGFWATVLERDLNQSWGLAFWPRLLLEHCLHPWRPVWHIFKIQPFFSSQAQRTYRVVLFGTHIEVAPAKAAHLVMKLQITLAPQSSRKKFATADHYTIIMQALQITSDHVKRLV